MNKDTLLRYDSHTIAIKNFPLHLSKVTKVEFSPLCFQAHNFCRLDTFVSLFNLRKSTLNRFLLSKCLKKKPLRKLNVSLSYAF